MGVLWSDFVTTLIFDVTISSYEPICLPVASASENESFPGAMSGRPLISNVRRFRKLSPNSIVTGCSKITDPPQLTVRRAGEVFGSSADLPRINTILTVDKTAGNDITSMSSRIWMKEI